MGLRFFDTIDYYGMKAEFLGSLMVVLLSGIAYGNYLFKTAGLEEYSMTIGLTYCIFTWSGHFFSNAMYNPALTTTLIIFRKIQFNKGAFFILAQVIASILGASMIEFFTPAEKEDLIESSTYMGFPKVPKDKLGMSHLFVIMLYESLGAGIVTMAFYTIILSNRHRTYTQGAVMGAVYATLSFSLGPITGAALNPIRILGGCLIAREYKYVWPYVGGHYIGCFISGILMELLLMKLEENTDVYDGTNIKGKGQLKFVSHDEDNRSIELEEDFFAGTANDLNELDRMKRAEKELREKTGIKKYKYDDSDDEEMDVDPNKLFKEGYLDSKTETQQRKVRVDIDSDEEDVEIQIKEGDKYVAPEHINITKGDKDVYEDTIAGVDDPLTPAPIIVKGRDGQITEEGRGTVKKHE